MTRLREARSEQLYTTALAHAKGMLPDQLMIKGHNPLTLLYGAIRRGLHENTDEGCLELATNIRILLTALIERIRRVREDEAELHGALSALLEEDRESKRPS